MSVSTREQAIEVAHAVIVQEQGEPPRKAYWTVIDKAIDAAAEQVWEPMVRHLMEAGDALVRRFEGKPEVDEVFHWVKSVMDIEAELKGER